MIFFCSNLKEYKYAHGYKTDVECLPEKNNKNKQM